MEVDPTHVNSGHTAWCMHQVLPPRLTQVTCLAACVGSERIAWFLFVGVSGGGGIGFHPVVFAFRSLGCQVYRVIQTGGQC